jgi:hypothetical protein
MPNRKPDRPPKPIAAGQSEPGPWRLGVARSTCDPYHLAVSLSWPRFILPMIGVWLTLNVVFAALYAIV